MGYNNNKAFNPSKHALKKEFNNTDVNGLNYATSPENSSSPKTVNGVCTCLI